ncbi:FAD-binding domain-containing protein [Stipitochalara longipes BDJ]|nr:FAD-binding domain-containing protein [Stipitochalara longipes BDJ]
MIYALCATPHICPIFHAHYAAEKQAAIIVFPISANDVSEVVKFATEHHIEIAVCGGGHATSGSSSSEGGICIDLSRFNEVSVKPKENIVIAEGGALWADVDKAAAEHGLAVVGGTVNTTGVGGLALDHSVWGGTLVIDINDLDNIVAFANEFLMISNPKSALIWGFKALTPNNFSIVAAVFYSGPEPLGTALFYPLLKLQLLANSTKNCPCWTMNTLFDDLESGHCRSMKGFAFFVSLDLGFAKLCLNYFPVLISEIPDALMSIMVFEFFPFHKIISVKQDSAVFSNRGAYGNLLWIMSWTQVKHNEYVRQWTRGVGEYFNYDGLADGGTHAFGNKYAGLGCNIEVKIIHHHTWF